MKITKSRLKQIIKEEVSRAVKRGHVLREGRKETLDKYEDFMDYTTRSRRSPKRKAPAGFDADAEQDAVMRALIDAQKRGEITAEELDLFFTKLEGGDVQYQLGDL